MDFASGGIFSGVQKQSTGSQLTTSNVSGNYTINSDCTVTASRTINGVAVTGASVVLGNGFIHLATPWIWQGEDCQDSTESVKLSDAGTNDDEQYSVENTC
jgi:hypothetical protein